MSQSPKSPKGDDQPFRLACRSDATVLITGPTGSGKTFLARQLHERGARRGKPFINVNLASLHEGTLESELFGHERGAFTGADQRRIGRLELAQGGTVFLDEVGELTPRLQARLLEFLQFKIISPVGGNREIRLDLRIIAATHRDLARDVASGRFREDLFHRLRVIAIGLKPLRERCDEFDRIVHAYLAETCAVAGRSVLRISEAVAERLERHDWPGNLRELRNVLEYAVLSSEGAEIQLSDLPSWFADSAENRGVFAENGELAPVADGPGQGDYHCALSRFEKEYLRQALARYRGRINHTARQIGMNKTTLLRRMRVYGLNIAVSSDLSCADSS